MEELRRPLDARARSTSTSSERRVRRAGRRLAAAARARSCASCWARSSRAAARSWSTGRPLPAEPRPERGIVFQRYSVFPHLTVLQNLLLGLELARHRCAAASAAPRAGRRSTRPTAMLERSASAHARGRYAGRALGRHAAAARDRPGADPAAQAPAARRAVRRARSRHPGRDAELLMRIWRRRHDRVHGHPRHRARRSGSAPASSSSTRCGATRSARPPMARRSPTTSSALQARRPRSSRQADDGTQCAQSRHESIDRHARRPATPGLPPARRVPPPDFEKLRQPGLACGRGRGAAAGRTAGAKEQSGRSTWACPGSESLDRPLHPDLRPRRAAAFRRHQHLPQGALCRERARRRQIRCGGGRHPVRLRHHLPPRHPLRAAGHPPHLGALHALQLRARRRSARADDAVRRRRRVHHPGQPREELRPDHAAAWPTSPPAAPCR